MSTRSPETLRAALLLSNRLTNVGVAPLKAREFWALLDRVDAAGFDLAALPGDGALLDAVAFDAVTADRVAALLDATRSMAFEIERLSEGGIELMSALDDRFPPLIRQRLQHGCPPHVFAAGTIDGLTGRSLSIVGDGDLTRPRAEQVRQAVAAAVVAGWSVVTPTPAIRSSKTVPSAGATAEAPAAAGSDVGSIVVDEATACHGDLICIADAGIHRVARLPELRRMVQADKICLLSPFAPDDAPSAAATRARDSIVNATSDLTLVIGCQDGTGPTWASVVESVGREPNAFATIVDADAPPGNRALARLGAHELTTVDDLHTLLA